MTKAAQRYRDAGCCTDCGVKTPLNPRTGEPFRLCLKHRVQHAATTHQWRTRRRQVQERAAA